MNNRKTAVNFDSIGNFKSFTVFPKSEQKKEFSTMFEILNDAEKYHEAGEKETSKSILNILRHHIDKFGTEDEGKNKRLYQDQEHRDILSAELRGKKVSFKTILTPFFIRKYKGV